MDYAELAQLYSKLEATSKRLEKTKLLADFLKTVPDSELESVILLLQGKIFPAWDKRTLGVSSKLIVKAIKTATGTQEARIEQLWAQLGDLGLVAQQLLAKKTQAVLASATLSVKDVHETLKRVAQAEGKGSVETKTKLLAKLLTLADAQSTPYIVRTVLENLRVGIAEGILRDAIAWAYLNPPIQDDLTVTDRQAYNRIIERVQSAIDKTNDYALVARAAKQGTLDRITITLGRPLRVMLAQRESSLSAALDRVGRPAQLEYKYDGFRLQCHKEGNAITLFTRRLENVTDQFPDVVAAIREAVKAKNCILDGEAVGIDPHTGTYRPFQNISQRIKRKYHIERLAQELPVELNVFDLLFLNGKPYLNKPLKERRAAIEAIITPLPRRITPATCLVTSSDEAAKKFYQASLKTGNEGVMVKKLDAPYKPGARVGHMVKFKPTMDTLDLTIVGAEWGQGKRSGWLTSFTLACQDEEGNLLTVGKVGTGLKELEEEAHEGSNDTSQEDLTFPSITKRLKPLIIKTEGRDVEIKPDIVVEVKFEEIQKSPSYTSGYALRFPRLVRIREDRDLSDISTIAEIEQLFASQR
ncbi:ATP-dependent DNA ligase [Candidatus Woesearchaeota archaeon]|nr:MAG: ATP-dependent DNA ligase [Candidatus Woesearchaeota archaeon]